MDPYRITLLDASTLGDTDLSVFSNYGDFTSFDNTPAEKVADRIARSEIVITNKVVLDAKIIDEAPRLRLILVAATGTNNIDLEAAGRRNIPVANVVGYSTESVVAHTFALYFYLAQQMERQCRYGHEEWPKRSIFTILDTPFAELSGKEWGIIGLGAIGRRVAEVASSFKAKVSYFSASGSNSHPYLPQLSLDELLRRSDIVSIHAPLKKETLRLIAEPELRKMKPTAVLLNLGRGGIVDETALAIALRSGELAAAGLDVLENEPPAAENPLLDEEFRRGPLSERLAITPHIAWASSESRQRLVEQLCSHLKQCLRDGPDSFLR